MEEQVVVKTIVKSFEDKLKAGIAWFRFILSVNDVKFSKREIELLAYINSRGTISSSSAREEFCRLFSTTPATVFNLTSLLLKRKLLVKEKSKIKVNSVLRLDLEKKAVVRFFLEVKAKPNSNNSNSETNEN